MDPFSISCTTCQVGLKVRNPALIGQILTCPKCGSMVLVRAPEDGQEGLSPADPAAEMATQEPAAAPQAPATPLGQEAADTVEDFAYREGDLADAQMAAPPELPPDTQVDEAILPTDQWSPGSRVWRGYVQLGIAAGVGVMLAAGLFALVAARFREESVAVSPAATPLPSPLADPEKAAEPLPPAGRGATPPAENHAESDTTTSAPAEDASPDAAPSGTAPQPERQPSHEAERSRSEPDLGGTGASGAADQAASAASDSPPGFRPRESPELTAADRMTEAGSLSQLLRQVDSMLVPPQAALEQPAAEPEPPPPDLGDGEAVKPKLSRPAPRVVDVDQRLEDQLMGIRFENRPLVDFLRFLADFTAAPISIHPESLIWLQLTPDSPLTIELGNCSVQEVLSAGLDPLGLTFESIDGQLVVRRAETDTGDLRSIKLDVSDLTGGNPARLDQLAELVATVVAPDSWTQSGGPGSIDADGALIVENDEELLFEVLFLCEKLRFARGLETQSRYDPSLFDVFSRTRVTRTVLDRPITLTFLTETRFEDIVGHLERAAGVRFLIDWPSLAEEGWNPDAELVFRALDEPLERALASLLAPMNLGYRVVGSTMLQIASQERISDHSAIECYPASSWLPAGGDAAATVDDLKSELGRSLFEATAGSTISLHEPGQTLVVAAPLTVHQRLVAMFSR